MNRFSNQVSFDEQGFLNAEKVDELDPFTMLKPGATCKASYITILSNGYCSCEHCDEAICYNLTQTCENCVHSTACYEDSGCLNVMPQAFYGSFELLFDMLKNSFRPEPNASRKTVPTLSPCPSNEPYQLGAQTQFFNMIIIEFEAPKELMPAIASKILKIPYIGNFALYPAYNPNEQWKEWVLAIPLDRSISYTQWTYITDWLCNELGVTNKASLHKRSPCPTNHYNWSRHFDSLAENNEHLFPPLAVMEMLHNRRATESDVNLDTIDPISYFNLHYCWQKLLTTMGFRSVNDTDWCPPDSLSQHPSVRIVGEQLHSIGDNDLIDVLEPLTKFEVAMKWNKQYSHKWLFDLTHDLPYGNTGLSVREYNRSRLPRFLDDNEQSEATSLTLKAGSEGWEEETNWLVKNQIQTDSLSMIYGPTASFKSFHAIDLAACVSTGSPWGDSEVMEGAVLYIAAEGNHGISKRIKAWEVAHDKPINKLFRIAQPVALAQTEGLTIVENAINEISKNHSKPVMIVIDTVARCFGGGDENSTKDMGEFIAACDHLRNLTGAAILLVHHTGKTPTKEARGNSSLKAALDTEFRVTRKDKQNSQGVTSKGYIIECTKQKDAEPQTTLFVALETISLNESGSMNSLCRNTLPEVWSSSKSDSKKSGIKKVKVASSQAQKDCAILSTTLNEHGGTTKRETLREMFNQTLPQETTATNKRARFSRALANLEKRGSVIIEQEGAVVTSVQEALSAD